MICHHSAVLMYSQQTGPVSHSINQSTLLEAVFINKIPSSGSWNTTPSELFPLFCWSWPTNLCDVLWVHSVVRVMAHGILKASAHYPKLWTCFWKIRLFVWFLCVGWMGEDQYQSELHSDWKQQKQMKLAGSVKSWTMHLSTTLKLMDRHLT